MTTSEANAIWETCSPSETIALGVSLGRALAGGVTIGLTGPLGAGKTLLVKGIAVGNALDDAPKVTSPTFTLVQEYPGRLLIYHLDVYRLKTEKEFLALGIEEMATPGSVMIVEWADRVRLALPPDTLWISMRPTNDSSRVIEFSAASEKASLCLAQLQRLRS